MAAIALLRRFGGTRSPATTVAKPMNAPWHNAATIRPPSMVPYVVARAETALPSTKKVSSATSTGLRLYRATRAVTIGPPITTLNAYELGHPDRERADRKRGQGGGGSHATRCRTCRWAGSATALAAKRCHTAS